MYTYEIRDKGKEEYHMRVKYTDTSVVAQREGSTGKPRYYHKDIVGSITAITDDAGDVLGEYYYYPFGELINSATNLGDFRFTGQEWNNDISWYHFPARYYEPKWGRFVTADLALPLMLDRS